MAVVVTDRSGSESRYPDAVHWSVEEKSGFLWITDAKPSNLEAAPRTLATWAPSAWQAVRMEPLSEQESQS